MEDHKKESLDAALLERIADLKFQLRESKETLKHVHGKIARDRRPPRPRSTDPELDTLYAMHYALTERHRKRGWPGTPITQDELIALHHRQQGRCFYTGLPYTLGKYIEGKHRNPLSGSVDRIDNDQGYVIDNVVICAWFVNIAKQAWPLDVIKPLWEHLPTK